jgi:hypothetical protein
VGGATTCGGRLGPGRVGAEAAVDGRGGDFCERRRFCERV